MPANKTVCLLFLVEYIRAWGRVGTARRGDRGRRQWLVRDSIFWENVYLHANLPKIGLNSCILECFTDVSRQFLLQTRNVKFWDIEISTI